MYTSSPCRFELLHVASNVRSISSSPLSVDRMIGLEMSPSIIREIRTFVKYEYCESIKDVQRRAK